MRPLAPSLQQCSGLNAVCFLLSTRFNQLVIGFIKHESDAYFGWQRFPLALVHSRGVSADAVY
jgi:hypothetical protein